jgi:6-phosphogluconolactonase
MKVRRFLDEASWLDALRVDFEGALSTAKASGRVLELLLSGGSTPEPAYRALAALRLRSQPVRLWLGDERAVGPTDASRNGVLVSRCFSCAEWEPAPDIKLWPAGEAAQAASGYATEIRRALGTRPSFDVALLGFGADGHTASLFPDDEASREALMPGRQEITYATRAPVDPRIRMSLGIDCLTGVRVLRFLSRGRAKDEVLRRLERDEGRVLPARVAADLAASKGADVVFYHLDVD